MKSGLLEGELQEKLLWSYAIGARTLTPIYRKPFDLIVKGTQIEEWSRFLHDYRTFCASAEAELALQIQNP